MYGYLGDEGATTISGFLMLLKPNKEVLIQIKEFDNYIYQTNIKIYEEMCRKSKIVRILHITGYNYVLYKIMSSIKITKIRKEKG